MKLKLHLSRQALLRAWGGFTLAAVVMLLLFRGLEAVLKARSGYGIADLQFAADNAGARAIFDRWQVSLQDGLAGFLLGLDFLFILLTGAALFLGALAAREAFAPKPGGRRRLFDALTAAPLLAMAGDLVANALHAIMMQLGASPYLATLAFEAALVNAVGAAIGAVLSLAAAVALLGGRLVQKNRPQS